jgi:hypothetical protein
MRFVIPGFLLVKGHIREGRSTVPPTLMAMTVKSPSRTDGRRQKGRLLPSA